MGFKRPFEDEKFHELPLKHSRQLDYNDKSTQFEEVSPHHAGFQKTVATVNEGNLCKSQGGESSEGDMFDEESNYVYPGHDMDDTFTWDTQGCGGRDATYSPHSGKYFELDIPPRVFAPVETFYYLLLDQRAKKQVPIGPGHQAEIPEWEGSQTGNIETSGMSVQNHISGCADGEKLFGTSVIPMPGLTTVAHIDDIVGKGRKFCVCRDRDSVRCVCQHIKEAREELVKTFGNETFKELGLCEMGEKGALKWSDEDAQLFHEVVYSNPVTLGQNFWRHLEAAFCSRTQKEIVSFYFNVFVLRRRAIQNRAFILDIDSDDDEWHGCYGGSSGTRYVEEDEEDSAIESPLHQGTKKVYPLHHEEGEEDVSHSSNDEDDDDTKEGGTGLYDEHKMSSTVEYMDRFSGNNGERLNVEDDSCTSFELARNAVNCAEKDETVPGEQQKKLKDCNDPIDTKVWDASRCLNVPTNGKDLQPTRRIMEEIFGNGCWENKARNK
ncbi:Contains similarity to a putative MYB family transcription factor gene T4M8.10 gi/4335752 from Arabidopsis thaliana BAC T4M8 gb/AC006284 and contains a Myb-like DNA-binding PF/00249 domain. ESTs gb/T75914, gb/T45901 come from this gene [Arabidopsis thaliana]|uniref:At1g26580 n=2 Tax=Arabidopsis thaliana TaxID=3702 RepID=Q9FZE2_ARATH|nr:ELM2 domain protein [Arabidopsis thaliana]NP_173980.1 ELM2 domain protein [Arabidopsis thaliana]AAF98560.1 Contains similarity to a putative MYB family transcription factor gene T4M8.10 gi/4335752 from Arabidopsis thaliana BAC T4M8 gb/AC006284 and contains a Myb-like DNA-binding PF/00249 domain. ESTs gb/T75914, gb/T45901 come from this gene [Arabidopsis thaliana]AAS47629.1 At1g26580 [Arabidopsis thaliana]AAS76758.1 At1g26580 [Arabidopsis thaliana]AEE30706.1 ELM2 domain protein [Arabidopsis |eukprot:NP_001321647.1 ELM2 domain protein [Arabidopsis thaliana]